MFLFQIQELVIEFGFNAIDRSIINEKDRQGIKNLAGQSALAFIKYFNYPLKSKAFHPCQNQSQPLLN